MSYMGCKLNRCHFVFLEDVVKKWWSCDLFFTFIVPKRCPLNIFYYGWFWWNTTIFHIRNPNTNWPCSQTWIFPGRGEPWRVIQYGMCYFSADQRPCGKTRTCLHKGLEDTGGDGKKRRRRRSGKLTTACREGVVNLLHYICQVRAAVVGVQQLIWTRTHTHTQTNMQREAEF